MCVVDLSKLCLFAVFTIVFATAYCNYSFGASSTGILVPLYVFPENATSWQPLIDAKINHPSIPMIAVINPSNGSGTVSTPEYSEQIPRLPAVGIKTIGYVTTDFANKPIEDVKVEIDLWKQLYPSIGGIFFDEMSNLPGNESYYDELDAYAKSKEGFDFTVGNAGVDTLPSYVGTVDNIVIHENNSFPTLAQLSGWHASHDKSNFSILVHSQPQLDGLAIVTSSNHVSYLYVTNNELNPPLGDHNPWDTISTHLDNMTQFLDKPSVAITIDSRDFVGDQLGSGTTSNNGANISISAGDHPVRVGSSPLFYNATNAATYTISANDFGNFTFAHWENFDTSPTRTITSLQDTTLVAFYDDGDDDKEGCSGDGKKQDKEKYDDVGDAVDSIQLNAVHATAEEVMKECFLINGNGIIESGLCKVKTITTPKNACPFIAQFQLDVTPNNNGAAKKYTPKSIPPFESFFSTCDWVDADGNPRSTTKWMEIVSTSGKAVLTCLFKK